MIRLLTSLHLILRMLLFLSFQVVSRGRILSHNTTDPFDGMIRSWSFRVTPQMSPSARLIGYYIDNNGRVVVDSILLDIEDSLPTEVIKAFAYAIETATFTGDKRNIGHGTTKNGYRTTFSHGPGTPRFVCTHAQHNLHLHAAKNNGCRAKH